LEKDMVVKCLIDKQNLREKFDDIVKSENQEF